MQSIAPSTLGEAGTGAGEEFFVEDYSGQDVGSLSRGRRSGEGDVTRHLVNEDFQLIVAPAKFSAIRQSAERTVYSWRIAEGRATAD